MKQPVYIRKRQYKTAKDRYLETILQAMGLAGPAGYKSHVDALFLMSHEIMGLTRAGKSDTMQTGTAKSGMKTEGKKMKIDNIVEKINNSCKPFDFEDLREIFTAANSAEGLKLLERVNDTDDIPIDIIDSALYGLGYMVDGAGTYRKL